MPEFQPQLLLSKREARALAVIASRLDRRPFRRRVRKEDILDLIRHLGMIQLDTISVISRAHETAIWSRFGTFDTDLITKLFEDRQLTEYNVHAAAILPTCDLPLFRHYMMQWREEEAGWLGEPQQISVANLIRDRIRQDGPVTSGHFDAPNEPISGGPWSWWGSKPERPMLHALWSTGDVLLSKRDSAFRRHYDLMENVFPEFWQDPLTDIETRNRELLLRALRALGVTTLNWSKDYYRTGKRPHVWAHETKRLMPVLAEEGFAIPVSIEGMKETAWLNPALMTTLESLRIGRGWPTLTTFLSPFDNLIWNRDRCKKLFEHDYELEIYVPAARRRYGYYTLPILHRGKLVGLIDPSFDRRRRHLTIRAVHLFPEVKPTLALARAIGGALNDLTWFLGGRDAHWGVSASSPPEFAAILNQAS